MKETEQRIAIAEACGYQRVQFEGAGNSFLEYPNRPATHYSGARLKEPIGPLVMPGPCWIPDYLNDLNACHEMEKVLSADDKELFAVWLSNIVLGHGSTLLSRKEMVKLISPTADQRCKAFLRTLNLWKD